MPNEDLTELTALHKLFFQKSKLLLYYLDSIVAWNQLYLLTFTVKKGSRLCFVDKPFMKVRILGVQSQI